MKWNDSDFRETTDKIIKAFYKVYDTIGPGFLEDAYHKALYLELKKHFANVDKGREYPIIYDKEVVGHYVPDIVVEERIVIEVKAVKELNENHKAQLISQLRVTGILIGFLVNFSNKDLIFKRFVNFYEIERQGLNETLRD